MDWAALILTSEDDTWWATSRRGGTDVLPLDGELDQGPDGEPITRIRVTSSGENILLNVNNSAFSMAAHYGASGTVSPWTMHIQTATGMVESNQLASTGGGFANFEFGAAAEQLFIDAIAAGTRVIIGAYQ